MNGKSYFGKVCIAASFLIMSSLTGNEVLFAQTILPSDAGLQYITIHVKKKNLIAVMAEIAAKSNLNFHYDKAAIDPDKKVTLRCEKVPLNSLLEMLSLQTGFDFTLRDDKVVVSVPVMNSNHDDEQLHDTWLRREISGQVVDIR